MIIFQPNDWLVLYFCSSSCLFLTKEEGEKKKKNRKVLLYFGPLSVALWSTFYCTFQEAPWDEVGGLLRVCVCVYVLMWQFPNSVKSRCLQSLTALK